MIIVFEGLDGCGKTTLAKKVAEELDNSIYLREPGGTTKGEEIRGLIKRWPSSKNLFLFLEARKELCDFIDKLENKNVVLDRFTPSTLAYQQTDTTNIAQLYNIDSVARNGLKPDIVFFINIEPKQCAFNIAQRKQTQIDQQKLEVLQKTHANYQEANEFLKSKGWNIINVTPREGESFVWTTDIMKLL